MKKRNFSKRSPDIFQKRQHPVSPLFHFLTYSLSDTGLVHDRRLKRLPKRHGPLIQGQHMRKTEIVLPPPTGLQSLIPEQPAPQLKGSSQVLFTYNIYVKVSCYPAPRCGGKGQMHLKEAHCKSLVDLEQWNAQHMLIGVCGGIRNVQYFSYVEPSRC